MKHYKCKTFTPGLTVGARYTDVHPEQGSRFARVTNDEGSQQLVEVATCLTEVGEYAKS